MTLDEFSNEFDVIASSYTMPEGHGTLISPYNFDEYEKSVFLTKAQEDVVKSLYTGTSGFESTEQIRRYLSDLIRTESLPVKKAPNGISDNSSMAVLPDELMFITYESAKVIGEGDCFKNGKEVQVIPVTQDEYHRLKENPFRRANSRKVLRLDLNDNMVELISPYTITSYTVRYLERPTPIILVNLPKGLSINKKYNTRKECKLNPDLHRMILEVAVANAIKSRSQGKSN